MKLRSLVSPNKLGKMTFKDLHVVVQNYGRPRQHVVVADRAKFLTTFKNQKLSDDDFLEDFVELLGIVNFQNLKISLMRNAKKLNNICLGT